LNRNNKAASRHTSILLPAALVVVDSCAVVVSAVVLREVELGVVMTVDLIGTTVVSGTTAVAEAVAGTDIVLGFVVAIVVVDSVVSRGLVGSAEKRKTICSSCSLK
jgi:hypothetical protein